MRATASWAASRPTDGGGNDLLRGAASTEHCCQGPNITIIEGWVIDPEIDTTGSWRLGMGQPPVWAGISSSRAKQRTTLRSAAARKAHTARLAARPSRVPPGLSALIQASGRHGTGLDTVVYHDGAAV